MTDHTVQAYLEGLSTEELLTVVEYCMRMHRWSSYAYAIPQIIEILNKRRYTIPRPILES